MCQSPLIHHPMMLMLNGNGIRVWPTGHLFNAALIKYISAFICCSFLAWFRYIYVSHDLIYTRRCAFFNANKRTEWMKWSAVINFSLLFELLPRERKRFIGHKIISIICSTRWKTIDIVFKFILSLFRFSRHFLFIYLI